MLRIRRDRPRAQRALVASAYLESLEHRTLLSFAAPVAITPGSADSPGPVTDSSTLTFKWSGVDRVDGYEIHIYDKTKASYFSADVSGASTTTYSATLRPGDQYVWNVRDVVGSSTVAGTESNYLNFQTPGSTVPTLPAPVAQSPGTAAAPGPVVDRSTVTFKWSAVDGVSGYHINVYDATKKTGAVSADVGADATSYTATLAPGDQYVWNVRDVVNGTTGAVSNYLNFQTPGSTTPTPTPTAPVAKSPGTADAPGPVTDSSTVTFTWSAVDGVSGYHLNIWDDTKGAMAASPDVAAGTTSYTATLAPGDKYTWNVRDIVNGTVTNIVSNYLNFQTPAAVTTTPLPAPTITGPGSSPGPGPVLDTLTPTLTWNAVDTTAPYTGFQINLYDNTAKHFQSFIVSDPAATSYTLPAGTLIAGDSYTWNLRLRNGDVTGPVSHTYLFFQAPAAAVTNTVLPAPANPSTGSPSAPGVQLSTHTPVLRWTPVASAARLSGYQVTLYNLTTHRHFIYNTGRSAARFGVTADMLVGGDQYAWNVRSLLRGRTGAASTSLYFTA